MVEELDFILGYCPLPQLQRTPALLYLFTLHIVTIRIPAKITVPIEEHIKKRLLTANGKRNCVQKCV